MTSYAPGAVYSFYISAFDMYLYFLYLMLYIFKLFDWKRFGNSATSSPGAHYDVQFSSGTVQKNITDLLNGSLRVDFSSNVKGKYNLTINCAGVSDSSSWNFNYAVNAGKIFSFFFLSFIFFKKKKVLFYFFVICCF